MDKITQSIESLNRAKNGDSLANYQAIKLVREWRRKHTCITDNTDNSDIIEAVNGGMSETTIALGFQPGEMPAKIYDPFDDSTEVKYIDLTGVPADELERVMARPDAQVMSMQPSELQPVIISPDGTPIQLFDAKVAVFTQNGTIRVESVPLEEFFIKVLFGWQRKEGGRRFRKAYLEIARKNGKTELAAAIAVYCFLCDNETGAEVYTAATTRDQARIAFDTAKVMLKSLKADSRSLRRHHHHRALHSALGRVHHAHSAGHGP